MSRYRFGGYTVDADTIEVVGPDGVREVEPQVFDVLRYLVEPIRPPGSDEEWHRQRRHQEGRHQWVARPDKPDWGVVAQARPGRQ